MTPEADYPVLSGIDSPADLRRLPERALADLARELRRYLVESVSQSGGHFAAGLGAVELAIALHYRYDTPHDRIVWDVGHQSYPHKILTGRREQMHSVRKWGGISPFPKRAESPYDTFGVGHAGTSIGAAAGMAIAAQRTGSDRKVVAVIGDGGLTCGMAFEALNHAGGAGADMLVVFNDNEMSISPNVGALTDRFARLLSSRFYATVKESGRKVLRRMPPMQEFARRAEEHVKGLIVPGALFEEFGFNYVGPIDGHNLNALLPTLKNLRRLGGPQLLHVVTRKGKGYAPAESDPVKYHGIGSPFDPAVGIVPGAAPTPPKPTYSQVFGDWLCDMAERDERLVGITPAMREGSKMERFEQLFPERYFDVAIAEQHSVTFAAGLACEGLKPVVAIYSTFLQRAYDQVVHDVVLQDLPVMLAIDRAGVEPSRTVVAASGGWPAISLPVRPCPQHPRGEDAVEQRLHQGRVEEARAFLALEAHPERLFERGAHCGERGRVARRLDPREPVAGVGCEQPRQVLRLRQRGPVGEGATEILDETRTDLAGEGARRLQLALERGVAAGEPEGLERGLLARRILADERELAQVGRQHQTVAAPVAPDLLAHRRPQQFLVRGLGPRPRRVPVSGPRVDAPAAPAGPSRGRNRDGPHPGRPARRRRTPSASGSRRRR